MTGHTSILGSLHSVNGEGVVRMEDRFDTGIDDLWGALTDRDRLAHWFGEVEGELSQGSEFLVRIALSGQREGKVEACAPLERLRVTLHDPDPSPDLADHLRGRDLRDVDARWDELLPAYEALSVS